ncbi:hypothetical protein M514_10586 [Trichuris suis]|uniref:Uncharacterized protein n=1 Tax=Trichuris suis TaxID=68888 RepID=A0A085MSY6_9BILA|nr:hypothetical protein M513_10586 [Trichuris suis]KFD60332.1 hypothetical protein M514_10586 [Trichuris suis]
MTIPCGLSDDWDNAVLALCYLPTSVCSCAAVKQRLLAQSQKRSGDLSKGTKILAARATAAEGHIRGMFGKFPERWCSV